MPSKNQKRRSGETTRHRILQAAVTRFAQTSYEEVGLRDIAREVGVDVAYVHRCFGSKEQLFVEVLEVTTSSIEHISSAEKDELARVFTEHALERDPASLRIFISSLSSPQARDALRTFGAKNLIDPLAAKLEEPARLRACLLAACLTGVGVVREVLRLQPLHKASVEDCYPLIETIFQACLDGNIAPARHAKPSASKRKTKQVSGSSRNGVRSRGIKSADALISD